MNNLALYAITPERLISIPLQPAAHTLHDLYRDFPVGVYSVFRTFQHNKFISLQNHLDRLNQSMILLDWSYPIDHHLIRQTLHQICTSSPWNDMRVRIDVLKSSISVEGTNTRLLIGLEEFNDIQTLKAYSGVAVEVITGLKREIPLAKSADFVFKRDAIVRKVPGIPYEYLMVDKNNRILEGTSSNFFGVMNYEIWTADINILKGVTRNIILKILSDINFSTKLDAIPLSKVEFLSEAFLSSSTRGLIPIIRIGHQLIGDGKPGKVFQAVLKAYNHHVQKSIEFAIDTK